MMNLPKPHQTLLFRDDARGGGGARGGLPQQACQGEGWRRPVLRQTSRSTSRSWWTREGGQAVRTAPRGEGGGGEVRRPTADDGVFVERKARADEIMTLLNGGGGGGGVSRGRSQQEREAALADFATGRCGSRRHHVAARGLDVKACPNLDLPCMFEDYVHRVGRTGRAGMTGRRLHFTRRDSFLVAHRALQEFERRVRLRHRKGGAREGARGGQGLARGTRGRARAGGGWRRRHHRRRQVQAHEAQRVERESDERRQRVRGARG